jgi:hypothetical protein
MFGSFEILTRELSVASCEPAASNIRCASAPIAAKTLRFDVDLMDAVVWPNKSVKRFAFHPARHNTSHLSIVSHYDDFLW